MVRRLVVSLVGLVVCMPLAGCGHATDVSPGDARYRPPTPVLTPPVEGTVRAVGGGPLPNVPVVVWGVADSAPSRTMTDGAGHYALPPMQLQGNRQAWVSSDSLPGYISGLYPLGPSVTGQTEHIDVHVQPELALADQMEFDLSDDDIAYGYGPDFSVGLPPRRHPVKVFELKTRPPGALELRADWSGSAPIRIWIERAYLEDSLESVPVPGESAATLTVPDGWLHDPRVGSFIELSVGVPESSAGLAGPVHVRLTVRSITAPTS
jgi:hypothetical protein